MGAIDLLKRYWWVLGFALIAPVNLPAGDRGMEFVALPKPIQEMLGRGQIGRKAGNGFYRDFPVAILVFFFPLHILGLRLVCYEMA